MNNKNSNNNTNNDKNNNNSHERGARRGGMLPKPGALSRPKGCASIREPILRSVFKEGSSVRGEIARISTNSGSVWSGLDPRRRGAALCAKLLFIPGLHSLLSEYGTLLNHSRDVGPS